MLHKEAKTSPEPARGPAVSGDWKVPVHNDFRHFEGQQNWPPPALLFFCTLPSAGTHEQAVNQSKLTLS